MSDSPEKIIQFLVSPQNDFIQRIEPGGEPPNKLHVGPKAVTKLRGNCTGTDPFVDTVSKFFDDSITGTDKLHVILDEDWHPENCREFKTWGRHCVKGDPGAAMPHELEEYRYHNRCHHIRANSFNISTDHRFDATIKDCIGNTKPERVRAGIIGVWTHIKVEYLLVALNTKYPRLKFSNIAICEPLCASPEKVDHDQAIRKIEDCFQAKVYRDRDEYCRDWLGLRY